MKNVIGNILLVEDDENLGFVIKDNLEDEGYLVNLAKDGEEGFRLFHSATYDICLLDVMLPLKDGFSLAQDIRQANQEVPIIFLTARSLDEDKIKGFQSGADDYITKPFSVNELSYRIKAVLKRTKNSETKDTQKDIFLIGEFSFDFPNQTLILKGSEQTLTKKEAEILKLLCLNKNQLVSRDMALKVIWGDNDYFKGRSMDVFITKLRKYLKDDPKVEIINIHGTGFKLTEK
ncbi:MAG: response regulator transcription factor [Bacteroidetes bacterium]|nr:response regulator transcription factor [Bacteroidota bacterium]